jgi:3',5'-cyclic AMP phosphodiesterase CpdA
MKKFILLLLGMFLSVGLSLSCSAENIKFVQITDSHTDSESEYSIRALKSAIDDINNQQDIAFVVFTGDNIASPKEDSLRAFKNTIKKLNVPYYVALGNHDVYKSNGLSKVRYFEILSEGRFGKFQKQPNYVFKKNGFVFIVLDGAKEVIPGTVGYYRQDTLKWLDNTLTKYKKRNVIIFQHFPVEYPEGVENRIKTHKTYKVEEYQEILKKHDNVVAVMSGHFHLNSEYMKDGVYHVSTPSLITVPQAYKIVDIVTSQDFLPIIYTQLREFEVKE